MTMGAMIIAKRPDMFDEIVASLKKTGIPYDSGNIDKDCPIPSFCMNPNGKYRFMFYGRTPCQFETDAIDIPEIAQEQGYRYGYLSECRDKQLFCRIFNSISPELDILICDNGDDENCLYRPGELDPATIKL